ncbi:MAG: hypothetical protein ACKV2O_04090 [Acidimicrobiales bacterium]
MGSSYENLMVLGGSEARVRQVLAGTGSLMTAEAGGVLVVFHEERMGDEGLLEALSAAATVLHFAVLDDDLLLCGLWRGGELRYEICVPDPARYFGEELDGPDGAEPGGADDGTGVERSARAYAIGVGSGDPERAIGVLDGDYVFATERHRDLLEALGLPTFVAGWGLQYLTDQRDNYDGPELFTT